MLGLFPVTYSCIQYDSLYHLAYALDFAVIRGVDFEDPVTLNYHLRITRYTGCTGAISFEKSTNNRSFSGFGIN